MFRWLSIFRKTKRQPKLEKITLKQVKKELESWYDRFYVGGTEIEVNFYVWEGLIERIEASENE